MPLDLDEADQGGQKYTVKVMWATQPHTYKARIKIEGDHMDAMKAKTILNSCDVVNKCHHVNTKGGHYFSSDSWLRKGSELDIWFRNRIGGDRRDEDLQMTSDELEHVVKMLLEVNNITMTQINFSRSKEEPISQKDAVYKINKRLAQCAIHAGVWEHQERNTETEWRNFFERNTQKLSWKITDYQILPNDDRDLSATIEFSNVPCGTAICDYILRNSNNNVFFKFNHVQVARTRFSCRYHSTFFVPPEIRVLLNADIKKLDGDVRKTTDGDHSSWARIRDLPNSMMSVEGWSREYVDDVVGQLKKKLKPEAFDCSVGSRSQLLYGCGLQLVNQQQDRFVGRVFISVDRLNEKITLIGEQAAIAGIKQCFLDFVDRPHNFAVQTAIKIDPPMYLPIMKSVLDYNGETALGELLGGCMVRFQKPNQLLFEGSVHQYNQLRLLLDKTQYEVLNKVTEKTISKRAKELFISTSECPVCTAPYSFDKYRIACGHAYCLQCLTLLIKHSLGSGEIPIRCVQPRCQKLVGIRDIMSLLFDEKSIQIRNFFPERLEPLFKAANKAAAKADDMIPCIKAGCEGFLERAEKEYIRTIYCPICRTARCSTCTNPPHVGRSCEQEVEFRSNDELAIEHYIKSRRDNVKKCPTKNCEALIQKEEGCNHMHCTFCKIHFCWSCLFSAESQQEVYAHMQNNHGGTGGEWAHLDLPPGFGFATPGFGGQGFGFRGFRGQSPPPGLRRPFPNQRGFLGNIEDSDSD